MANILWVEDDADMLMGLIKPLKEDGHIITIAYKEIEALRLIEEQDFDLVLLDILIPSGIDGSEYINYVGERFLSEFKKKYPSTPVIVISVVLDNNLIEKLNYMGISEFIIKGRILPDVLRNKVNNLLEKGD